MTKLFRNMHLNYSPQDYIRYECVNFECDVNPKGYFIMSPFDGDDNPAPLCMHCHAPMVREDVMATNVLLWELGIAVQE